MPHRPGRVRFRDSLSSGKPTNDTGSPLAFLVLGRWHYHRGCTGSNNRIPPAEWGHGTEGVGYQCSELRTMGPGSPYCSNMTDVKVVPWDPGHGITVLGVPINYPGSGAQGSAAWGAAAERLQMALERVTALTDDRRTDCTPFIAQVLGRVQSKPPVALQ